MKTTIMAVVAVVAALGAAGLVTAASFSTQAHADSGQTNCHPTYHPNHERGENLRDFCSPIDADH